MADEDAITANNNQQYYTLMEMRCVLTNKLCVGIYSFSKCKGRALALMAASNFR